MNFTKSNKIVTNKIAWELLMSASSNIKIDVCKILVSGTLNTLILLNSGEVMISPATLT